MIELVAGGLWSVLMFLLGMAAYEKIMEKFIDDDNED